jgi:ATP-dependent helicase HrpB
MISLPIDEVIPSIVSALRAAPSVVIEAPPGAGKTTRVPRALLDAGFAANGGEILVLQPRRLAARMAARRVAEELGEPVGKSIGFQVRYEDQSSAATRVRFVTEGVLTRKIFANPNLPGISVVVLDEFHERHLDGDLALAWLRRLQSTSRPELKLVVMSATLDAEPVARFLGDCPRIRSEGKRYPVTIEPLARPDDRATHELVASAVRKLCEQSLDGDVLVFLPGAAEIRRSAEAVAPVARAHNLLVHTLHGELSPAEQDRAIAKADRRKVLLSTNVAETSVTIDGVVAVIDSGLARIASHSPWSGLPLLKVSKISKASATQRAGRAGRTQPGRCLRLYTQHDFELRQAFDSAEIARADLSQLVLLLRSAGVRNVSDFGWFERPKDSAIAAAETLLQHLGALDTSGAVTDLGRGMLRFPLHPRLARLLLEGELRGVAQDAALMAALLAERDVRSRDTRDGREARYVEKGSSDLTALLDRFDHAARDRDYERAREVGLEPASVAACDRAYRQLSAMVKNRAQKPADSTQYDRSLRLCLLAGYADRVGRVRRPSNASGRASEGAEIVFAFGGTAKLAPTSAVTDADLVVALDAEERTDTRASSTVTVRTASAIESDWLLEMCTEHCVDSVETRFDSARDRVEAKRVLSYGSLTLEEKLLRDADPVLLAKSLAKAALDRGLEHFVDADQLHRVIARTRFVRAHFAAESLRELSLDSLAETLEQACVGLKSFAELKQANLLQVWLDGLLPAERRLLDEVAPERVELPGGRRVQVQYPKDGAPFIESRLQDFFGMADGPRIARGRVALVLHLLAPNTRAVQVTTDLAGFWSKHYATIAKELRRKYPRHPFPDDPLTATPPAPKR